MGGLVICPKLPREHVANLSHPASSRCPSAEPPWQAGTTEHPPAAPEGRCWPRPWLPSRFSSAKLQLRGCTQGGKELPKIQGGAAAGATGPSVTAVTPRDPQQRCCTAGYPASPNQNVPLKVQLPAQLRHHADRVPASPVLRENPRRAHPSRQLCLQPEVLRRHARTSLLKGCEQED